MKIKTICKRIKINNIFNVYKDRLAKNSFLFLYSTWINTTDDQRWTNLLYIDSTDWFIFTKKKKSNLFLFLPSFLPLTISLVRSQHSYSPSIVRLIELKWYVYKGRHIIPTSFHFISFRWQHHFRSFVFFRCVALRLFYIYARFISFVLSIYPFYSSYKKKAHGVAL
jgi:hypothetical protein